MDAYISGQASLAIILDGRSASCFSLDDPWPPKPISLSLVPLLLQDCHDVAKHSGLDKEQVERELELAWSRDRSIRLAIVMLDNNEELIIRKNAATHLNELLEIESVSHFLKNSLYSCPLSSVSDYAWAVGFTETQGLSNTNELVRALLNDQDEIRACSDAWGNLPIDLFNTREYKNLFKSSLLRIGAFREVVQNWGSVDATLIKLHVNETLRGMKNARTILQRWAEQFRGSITDAKFVRPSESDSLPTSRQGDRYEGKISHQSAKDILENVNKQKHVIKLLIDRGDVNKAMDYTRQLVASQLQHSTQEHISMSLCDLAQQAKARNNFALQLELSKWAAEEAPLDSWAQAQVGDAYRQLGEVTNALDHYERAGQLGDRRIALAGRAEVLKDCGDLESCLQVYDECVRLFPNDPVSKNGRAAALAFFGRLDLALSEYEAILNESPNDDSARCGKAQVLRELGRYQEAMTILDNVLENEHGHDVARHMKAAVLHDIGKLEEARSIYEAIVKDVPFGPIARIGLAHAKKDMGDYRAALQDYEGIAKDFKHDEAGLMGMASIMKIQGRSTDAVAIYDKILETAPRLQTCRNAKASLMAAMGDYGAALDLLPTNDPSTQVEWMAFHIRGMIWLRQGKISFATEVFERGLESSPWHQGKHYFRTSLSLAMLRKEMYAEATRLIELPVSPALRAAQESIKLHLIAASGNLAEASEFASSIQRPTQHEYQWLHGGILAYARLIEREAERREYIRIVTAECDQILLAA